MTKSRGILGPRHRYTDAEIETIRARYPHEKTATLAASLGLRVSQIYQRATALGLKKSEEYLNSPASGRTSGKQGTGTRFEKGHATWNKGMKGLSLSDGRTQFKPGQKPTNTLPIGSLRITKDGTLQRKISDAKGNNSKRWRGVHELVWVEANGPVPDGHIVVFKQGERTDKLEEITLDRVECISFAENMRRNTVHNLPKELAELIQLRGALNRQINKRSGKNERQASQRKND